MTTLYMVRHGPTHAKSMVGWSDLPADLSDTAAVSRLDASLPGEALIISSDLSRTRATADALQGKRKRLPHDPALREIHFGDWEMRRFDDIEAEDPERISAFWQEPGLVRAPGGESWHDMRKRTDTAIDRLVSDYDGESLVIVCHFGVILGQLERVLNVPTTEIFAQRIDPLSVSVIRRTQAGWLADPINHQP